MNDNKVLVNSGSNDEYTNNVRKSISDTDSKYELNPDNVESGLAKIVLTLVELIRKLIDKQAMRRVESGSLTEDEIERLGETLMKLELKMDELKNYFDLTDKDLNINLGPLGDLL